jgi:hypothetical protein
VREQAERFEACLKRFAWQALGSAGVAQVQTATYVLAEAPIAAVTGHLKRREPPPPLVDDLTATTYRAVVGSARRRIQQR